MKKKSISSPQIPTHSNSEVLLQPLRDSETISEFAYIDEITIRRILTIQHKFRKYLLEKNKVRELYDTEKTYIDALEILIGAYEETNHLLN